MLKRFTYIFLLSFVILSCKREPEISPSQADFFFKVFGGSGSDQCNALQISNSDEIVLTGSIDQGGESKMFLIKTDAFGNEVSWSPRFFGSEGISEGQAIAVDQENKILVAGYSQTDNSGELQSDFLVVKTDSEGNELWTKTIGGNKNEEASSIDVSDPHKYYIGGFTETKWEPIDKKRQAWIVALSSDGDSLWSRSYGGDADDDCKSILSLDNNYLLLVGSTNSFYSQNQKRDVFIAKVQKSNGVAASFVALGKSSNETGVTAILTPNGEILVLGILQVTATRNNICLWKLGQELQILEEYVIESVYSETPSALHLIDDKFFLIGSTNEKGNEDMLVYVIDSGDINTILSKNIYGSKGDQLGLAGDVSGKSLIIGGCNKPSLSSSKVSLFKTSDILP